MNYSSKHYLQLDFGIGISDLQKGVQCSVKSEIPYPKSEINVISVIKHKLGRIQHAPDDVFGRLPAG